MTNLESVLHVNVRLSEGGAAGVARTIADGLRKRGIGGQFAYGYSKGGKASPLEDSYDAVRITPSGIAATNRLFFPIAGDESPLRSRIHWPRFEEAVANASVVHFHAVHSHIARVDDLVDVVIRAGKPLVWTMHDQWHFTGRCAQPGGCRLWESGCTTCPDLNAYPSARVDRARRHWPGRRAMVERVRAAIPFALVPCASWLQEEATIADLMPDEAIPNSVDHELWSVAQNLAGTPRRDAAESRTRFVFSCRDLRDPNKVDWPTLRAIGAILGVELTVIGDHAPDGDISANLLPSISSREELAREFAANDALIFLSQVDYFPLTVTEALTLGIQVVAVDSPAAREFEKDPKMHIFPDKAALVAAASSDAFLANLRSSERSDPQPAYAPDRMVNDYVATYSRLLTS